MDSVFVIGISGGSGSGKTTLAKKLAVTFSKERQPLPILGQDSYYIDQSSKFDRDGGSVNFDHPQSLEFSLMAKHLRKLKEREGIEVPMYDYATHRRLQMTTHFASQECVIFEGTLILSQPILRPLIDVSIFLEVEEELRFQRRLKRDTEERGRSPEGVKEQFYSQVKPMHDLFVEPSKEFADILISNLHIHIQKKPQSLEGQLVQKQVVEALERLLKK